MDHTDNVRFLAIPHRGNRPKAVGGEANQSVSESESSQLIFFSNRFL
jgi:hypothetical protein